MTTEIWTEVVDFYNRMHVEFTILAYITTCLLIGAVLKRYSVQITAACGSRRALDGIVGVVVTFHATRSMILCSSSLIVAHLLLYKFVRDPRKLSKISFFGTLAYWAFLRWTVFAELAMADVTNLIQMLMTLRTIGLSYEIADARTAGHSAGDSSAKSPRRTIIEPTTFQAFNYLYGFVGLVFGPYYTYLTFEDSDRFGDTTPSCLRRLIYEKTSQMWWTLSLTLVLSYMDPLNAIRGEKINDYTTVSLLVWAAIIAFHLRLKFYTLWLTAETVCIVAGVGVYPAAINPQPGAGPSAQNFKLWLRSRNKMEFNNDGATNSYTNDCECNSETISSQNIRRVEQCESVRSGMRAWNRTVQFWLANFVYRRAPRSQRIAYTLMVCALWHGLDAGYFLTAITVIIMTAADDLLFAAYPKPSRPSWMNKIWSFLVMRFAEYAGVPFQLLTWTDTVRVWSRLYFWAHIVLIAVIVVLKFGSSQRPQPAASGGVKKSWEKTE